jgi:hypothetical protein
MRNTWKLLAEAAYPARAYASRMPQIVNKSLVNQIFDRFVIDPEGPAYDEWSLYFNVAHHLYPRHFVTKPYGTLGWPMRPGDWAPGPRSSRARLRELLPAELRDLRARHGLVVGSIHSVIWKARPPAFAQPLRKPVTPRSRAAAHIRQVASPY